MPITVSNYEICRTPSVAVRLAGAVGGYALDFFISGSAIAVIPEHGEPRWLCIHGGSVDVGPGPDRQELWQGALAAPYVIRQRDFPNSFRFTLSASIAPGQLMAIEEIRDSGDITFRLRLFATGGQGATNFVAPEQLEFPVTVPQSEWVRYLAECRARDVILLEVAMPVPGTGSDTAFSYLAKAQDLFLGGSYTESVASCRKALEQLGAGGEEFWQHLKREPRRNMTKDLRMQGIRDVIHHYANLAPHAEQCGGAEFSRKEAKTCLAFAVAYASLVTQQA